MGIRKDFGECKWLSEFGTYALDDRLRGAVQGVSLAVHQATDRGLLEARIGGKSGGALKTIALRMRHDCRETIFNLFGSPFAAIEIGHLRSQLR